MTLRELKGILNALPDEFNDVEVAMSTDAEGNRYSPCVYVVTDGYCDDSSKYDIDPIYFDHHGYAGNCFESKKEWEDYKKNSKRLIVLWPMN
jgi:hypothetical protein